MRLLYLLFGLSFILIVLVIYVLNIVFSISSSVKSIQRTIDNLVLHHNNISYASKDEQVTALELLDKDPHVEKNKERNVTKDRETCNQYKYKYNIKTGNSWGSAPHAIQVNWKNMNCDSLTSVYGQDIVVGNFTKKPIVKLVIYDSVTGYLNWLQDWFVDHARENCNTYCLISHGQNNLHDADIILYHATTHSHRVPSTGNKRALHILISLEQPKYAHILNDKVRLNKFDALATYSMKPLYPNTSVTNIPLSYFSLEFMNISSIMEPPRPFKEKTGYGTDVNVTVFVSNCKNAGASGRYQYLEDFMKYITVHSYGRCLHNIDEPEIPDDPIFDLIGQRRSRKTKIISNYKFYLSFENDDIEDYVSGDCIIYILLLLFSSLILSLI